MNEAKPVLLRGESARDGIGAPVRKARRIEDDVLRWEIHLPTGQEAITGDLVEGVALERAIGSRIVIE
jgi:hypothetical protein